MHLRLFPRPGRPLRLVEDERPVGEGPERTVEGVDPVDAQVEALLAAAVHRHHLRSETFGQALPRGEAHVGRAAREVQEHLAAVGHLQRAPTLVLEWGGGQGHRIERVPGEVAGDLQAAPLEVEGQVRHRRAQAHQVPSLDRAQQLRRGRELHHHHPLARTGKGLLPRVARAARRHRHLLLAAAEAGDPEGLAGAKRDLAEALPAACRRGRGAGAGRPSSPGPPAAGGRARSERGRCASGAPGS